jgi:hypothetical protein
MEIEENELILKVKNEYKRINKHERMFKNRNDSSFLNFMCNDIIKNVQDLKYLYNNLNIAFVGITLHHYGYDTRYYNLLFNMFDSKNVLHRRKNYTYVVTDVLSYDNYNNEIVTL